MTLAQMHSWFRQYAQQMGMQNVRAILPEQIDMLINTATNDTVDEVIGRSIDANNDRIITDNVKIGNINSLKNMYRNYTMEIFDSQTLSAYNDGKISYNFSSNDLPDYRYIIDFSIRYFNNIVDSTIPTAHLAIIEDNASLPNILAAIPKTDSIKQGDYVICSDKDKKLVNNIYTIQVNSVTGVRSLHAVEVTAWTYYQSPHTNKTFLADGRRYTMTPYNGDNLVWDIFTNYTRWFPVRIIEDKYLADTLNDFVMSPRARSPILVTYGSTVLNNGIFTDKEEQSFDVYFGETSMENIMDNLRLAELRCSYIKSPRKVKYLSDVSDAGNVESDLPDQLQIPMLKHAVDLYRLSIQGSMFASQQNAQAQQQEQVRNNSRPTNEGYQS